jgi:hypothetical protein
MPQNEKALLERLHQQAVEFVVIGGVCGVIHGVPLVTLDLDICCRLGAANLRRLEAAVGDLHPWHRFTPNHIPFELTEELCASLKNLYLHTDLGTLDCLGEVLGVGDYDAACKHSVEFRMSFGPIRILDLDTLIVAKEALGREKDRYAVRLLRAIAEKNKPGA